MRKLCIVIVLLAMATPAISLFTGVSTANAQVTANRAQPLINMLGVVAHMENAGIYSAANVIADMNYLGLKRIREHDFPVIAAYNTVAAAGFKFNLTGAAYGCGSTASAGLATLLAAWDGMVAATPGSIIAIEGQNEINNQNPCYLNTQVTNATTASGNAILHFAATMPSVRAVATGGYGGQMVITDVTTPTAIPANTTVSSATATTVVMSANAAGAGVGSGDTIQFQAAGAYPNNSANGVAWQTDVYNGVHGDANLAGVPVLNMTDCCTPVGVAGTFDFNNMHGYPIFGTQVMNQFSAFFSQQNAGDGKPMQITETGFYTQAVQTDGVSQLAAARLQLNGIMDYFTNNLAAVYIYELIDVACNAAVAFDNFGLFNCTNAPKIGATAIKNFVGILTDAGSTALTFTPGALNYTVSGLTSRGGTPCGGPPTCGSFRSLLQKSNGNFYIVLWNEDAVWNETTLTDVTPTPLALTVNLGANFSTVRVYDPVVSAAPTTTLFNTASLNVSLAANLLIVELVPTAPATCP